MNAIAGMDPWPRRLRNALIALFAVAVPLAWVSASYFGRNPGQVESFNPADGWCDAATQGLGIHCFGDFQLPRFFLEGGSLYGDSPAEPAAPNPYTPTAMAPHVLARAVEWLGAGQRGSMVFYLVLLAASLLAPALWSILARRSRPRDWLPVLLIGVASGPFLMTMDRANSAGFAVPFLLLFALFLRSRPEWVSVVAIIAAACVRPQFILLALALLAFGRVRSFAAALGAWLAISIAAFSVYPGGFLHNLTSWWGDLGQFQADTGVAATDITNISGAHAVTVVGGWMEGVPGPIGSFGGAVIEGVESSPNLIGGLLAVVVLATFLFAPARRNGALVIVVALALPVLVQPLSYGYYLFIALPIAALILGPRSPDVLTGTTDGGAGLFALLPMRSRLVDTWTWLVILGVGLSLVPFILSSSPTDPSIVKGYAGLLWLVVVLVGTVAMWVSRVPAAVASGEPAPRPAP